jgi:hypothetical protein
MRDDGQFLCSELIKVAVDETVQVGNLERISAEGCTVITPDVIPIGAEVRMQCFECPKGQRVCRVCRYDGEVRSSQDDGPLGKSTTIEFTRRSWSPEEWQPGHLTDL